MMPYFLEESLGRARQKRPRSHEWLQEDCFEYVPPANDVLYIHPALDPSDPEQGARRKRIAAIATAYGNGKTPQILTATLRGPFDSTWTNPWACDDQNEDKALVTRLRTMLRQQRGEMELARREKVERRKRRDRNGRERKLKAAELRCDGLGQLPSQPVDLTAHETRRARTSATPDNIDQELVKRNPRKPLRDAPGGSLRGKQSTGKKLKSSTCDAAPPSSLPIRSSQPELGAPRRVEPGPILEAWPVKDAALVTVEHGPRHTSHESLPPTSTIICPHDGIVAHARVSTEFSSSPDFIPSSKPDYDSNSTRRPSSSAAAMAGPERALVKPLTAYQHATPTANSSPGFAYRRVAASDNGMNIPGRPDVLTPGIDRKSARPLLQHNSSRPPSVEPEPEPEPVSVGNLGTANATKERGNARKVEALAPDAQLANDTKSSNSLDQTTHGFVKYPRLQQSASSTQSKAKSRLGSPVGASDLQNAQHPTTFTISNEVCSTQAAMLEVNSAFQEAFDSPAHVSCENTARQQGINQTTSYEGIPAVVDTVTPFKDFHLRIRSGAAGHVGGTTVEHEISANTQDLFAAASPFRESAAKLSQGNRPGMAAAVSQTTARDSVRTMTGRLPVITGNGSTARRTVPHDLMILPATGVASVTPRSRESQRSTPSSDFSLTSPTHKAKSMTFEEGQRLLGRDSVDIDGNLDAAGSFFESWDLDDSPLLAKGTPRGSMSNGTREQRNIHRLFKSSAA